jgi:hypothetical protein
MKDEEAYLNVVYDLAYELDSAGIRDKVKNERIEEILGVRI